MEQTEWYALVGDINADIGGIVHNQRILNEINAELEQRRRRPSEEDFINAELGHDTAKARVRTIDGVEIRIRQLHRRGLRLADIKGADLLYEIAGRKFVLVQYKRPDGRGRVEVDPEQLNDLIDACPNPCPPHILGLWPTCGSWFAVRSTEESAYVPGCVAKSIFDEAHSRSIERFGTGLSHSVFQQLFARCWTGARVAPTEFAYLTWYAMEQDRVLFSVLQRGSFGRIQ